MAYTSDKKPGALVAATVLGDGDNVVVEQAGDVKKATLAQVEGKVFASKTQTTTPNGTEVVVVRQTDNSLRQVPLANIVPAGNITNALISDSAAIADTKLATIATAGKVANSATTATSANTASAIVARDGSGNFTAGTITATLSGNASTATTLQTGRTISLTGDVVYTSPVFNGSGNVTAAATIANDAVTTAKILDANVTTAKIADASVTTAKLADSSVTTAKIADGNITPAKLSSGGPSWDGSGNLTATGNVTAYSDERLKINVETLQGALEKIKNLRGVSYEKDGQPGIGVIAQELQTVIPEVVHENGDGYFSVAYGNLVGLLIEAVKELQQKIERLEQK